MKRHIVQDDKHCFGEPRIADTRITVEAIYDLFIGEGRSYKAVLKWWPYLTKAQVRAAVRYAERRKK